MFLIQSMFQLIVLIQYTYQLHIQFQLKNHTQSLWKNQLLIQLRLLSIDLTQLSLRNQLVFQSKCQFHNLTLSRNLMP
uniref:CSON006435 protein n=1 Tax=Culicoides sonorensis TaxID=179676 RepID=A0A336KG88_CULSO